MTSYLILRLRLFYFSEKSLYWQIQYGHWVGGFWSQMPFSILLAFNVSRTTYLQRYFFWKKNGMILFSDLELNVLAFRRNTVGAVVKTAFFVPIRTFFEEDFFKKSIVLFFLLGRWALISWPFVEKLSAKLWKLIPLRP